MQSIRLKFVLMILWSVICAGCSESSWTKAEQDAFLEGCDDEGGKSSYCQCYMEKVMKLYPNYADSKNLDFETAVELSNQCE